MDATTGPNIIDADLLLLAALPAAFLAWRPLHHWLREARRRRVRQRPLQREWIEVLEHDVPIYRRLPGGLRERLHGDLNVFLAEKTFYGQHGLEITDRMRLIIAAQACLLQLNQRTKFYPRFTSIIVYPDAYVATETVHDGLLESTHEHVRAGESWYRGPVVLSWQDIDQDLRHGADGHNVILHEFAHKLDEQDGVVDGAPELPGVRLREWSRVFMLEFERLRAALERGRHTFLDPYAATAPEEFFAVAVESFFERAPELRRRHPELYAALADFFALDPAAWPG